MTTLDNPPVKAIVVYNSNPAAVAPDQNRVLKGFQREDLFTVVLEQFQTDTADHADILLPSTTFLEHTDLYLAYGHFHLQLARPVVSAPGETRSNVEVFRELAKLTGFEDECFKDSEDDMIRALLSSGHPFLEGITLGAPRSRTFSALEYFAGGHALSSVCRGKFCNAVGQVRVRRGSAGLYRLPSNRVSEMSHCAGSIRWSWFPRKTTTA